MSDVYYLFCERRGNDVDTAPITHFVGRVDELDEHEVQLLKEALGDWLGKEGSIEGEIRLQREADVTDVERLTLRKQWRLFEEEYQVWLQVENPTRRDTLSDGYWQRVSFLNPVAWKYRVYDSAREFVRYIHEKRQAGATAMPRTVPDEEDPQPGGRKQDAAGEEVEGETRDKTSVPEANRILRQLAEKGAILIGRAARAEAWAAAIREVTGKTCSASTAAATAFWTENGNPRAKRGPEPTAVALTEALLAKVPADEKVLKALVDQTEEKAVQTVRESTLPDDEKAGIVQKLRDGEMTAAQAMETVRLAAEQHGENEPSPLDPDPPDRPRRVKHHRSV